MDGYIYFIDYSRDCDTSIYLSVILFIFLKLKCIGLNGSVQRLGFKNQNSTNSIRQLIFFDREKTKLEIGATFLNHSIYLIY